MWHGSKGYFFASVANAVINGLIAPLVLLLNRRLYNMLGSDRPMFLNALYIIAGIAAVTVVSWLWNLLSSKYIMPKLTEQLHMHVQTDLFEKARMIELEMYDDTEFYNDFILAMQYADAYATGTVNNFTNLMSNLIGFSGIVALLAYIDSGTMLVMVASAVISMLIGTKKQKINQALPVYSFIFGSPLTAPSKNDLTGNATPLITCLATPSAAQHTKYSK